MIKIVYKYIISLLSVLLVTVISPCILMIFLIIGMYAVISGFFCEERFRVRMKRCGRSLGLSNVNKEIQAKGGTLIIEYPSPGWRHTRAWWTPDDLFSKSTISLPTIEEEMALEHLDWYKWCWDSYLCPGNGRAYLLQVHNGKYMEKKLKKHFPTLTVVHVYTGLYFLSKYGNNQNQ
jgi:hypothetical protein